MWGVRTVVTRRLGVRAALVDGGLVPGDVSLRDGRVEDVGLAPAGAHGLAAPGFVDVHVHGHGGVDLLDADAAGHAAAARAMAAGGVTAFQPTFMSAAEERLVAALGVVDEARRGWSGAGPRVLAAHLEGPFLSPQRLGTHPAALRRDPDAGLVEQLLSAGPVGEFTLAPELPGALATVAQLVGRGVVVSMGHSDATAAQAAAGAEAGARAVTHLCNAMRPLHHREPGIAGWAMADRDVLVELIVDGHHLHGDMVRLVWRAAPDRVVLVTDGTAASGMPDGSYQMADVELTVVDGAVRNPQGELAGSALTMDAAVRNVAALGIGVPDALVAASTRPSQLLGRDDLGRLAPGRPADVVVLDDRLEVVETLVDGRTIHEA